ncbi:hypothetical protein IHE45_01G055400 [Dioscorea alata]|uniref:Uncharacterized protein n=1 Tax=Dioscorea alata TaxID=55571 RepID=A0ACB7WV63_DIOAL|nr:hypothetical protein IHE45_01G055400 [Dioscorea alata]
MRFFGPFKVIQKIGTVGYKLLLPEDTRIHPVFHVSLLKMCEGDPTLKDIIVPLPLKSIDEGPLLQPVVVLQFQQLLQKGQMVMQALIRWDENRGEDDSWIKTNFPDLEDKVIVNGGVMLWRESKGRQKLSVQM